MSIDIAPQIIQEHASAYHRHPAISRSMLKTFRKSRRLFYQRHILHDTPDEPETGAMIKGTVGHAVVLEGKSLEDCCVVIPRDALNADGHKKGKAWKEFESAHAGQPMLKPEEVDEALGSIKAILNQPQFQELSKLPCKKEFPIFWQADNGLEMRCLVDWLIPLRDRVIVWDFKFTADASPAGFYPRIRGTKTEPGLWLQNAVYSDGVQREFGKPVEFYFWAVDSGPPYRCVPHSLKPTSARMAHNTYLRTLDQLADCLEANDFADPCEKIFNEHELDARAFDDSPEVSDYQPSPQGTNE